MTTPAQTPPSLPPREPWGWTRRQRLGLGILASLLLAVLTVQFIRRPYRFDDRAVLVQGQPVLLPQRVNPNTATEQELARIPHVGDAMAGRIVAYREARKATAQDGIVFHQAADLDNVPQVGKKLIEQLEPFMEFPDSTTQP
jgi:Helix-hairpin-helix motif